MTYSLPTSLHVGDTDIPIRTSYQAALDILIAISDPEWSPREKAKIVFRILYKKPIPGHLQEEALRQAYWYLDGGQIPKGSKKSPRLIDWEQDFPLVVAPVNRVLGSDIRSNPDLHWWTFLSAYMEIGGDCLFSQVVNIRQKKARAERLEPYEKKWAARNAELIALPDRYTSEDNSVLAQYGIKAKQR